MKNQWAAYLMEQGVNVIIGGHPHVLQPYGRLTDDKGNETVVFYSLGNFRIHPTEAGRTSRRNGKIHHSENRTERQDLN